MIIKKYIIPLLAVIIVVALSLYGPIPQDQNFHQFADQRDISGVRNFLNVITNLPFAFVAIAGFYVIRTMDSKIKLIGGLLFTGFLLLTFGSGYYHLEPNNTTLVYDRIPIVIIIMSFFSLIIEDYLHPKRTTVWLATLNIIGIATVLYWAYSEQAGQGDLRWYAIVQFFPLLAVPIIMWLFRSGFNYRKEILLIFLFFLLAKLSETYDEEIYLSSGKVISGHSIKHLLMAAAGYGIILLIRNRYESIRNASSRSH